MYIFKAGKVKQKKDKYLHPTSKKLIYEKAIIDGIEHLALRHWYSNNKPRWEFFYMNKAPHGAHRRWYRDGETKSSSYFVIGMREGEQVLNIK